MTDSLGSCRVKFGVVIVVVKILSSTFCVAECGPNQEAAP